MNKFRCLCRILSHPRELRLALSGLAVRLGGDDALGGLSDSELDALIAWADRAAPKVFVEIGTLFGFTARTIASRTGARVVTVDNFCWNPFGLTSAQHETFTRKVLSPGSGSVTLAWLVMSVPSASFTTTSMESALKLSASSILSLKVTWYFL